MDFHEARVPPPYAVRSYCATRIEELYTLLSFEGILGADSCDGEDELNRAGVDGHGWNMQEGHVFMEAVDVCSDVPA